MRFPYRPQKPPSTPALPSILTLFPADHDHQISRASSREQANSHQGAAHGLEVVPIERCNTSCGKTVSPDTEEKEVLHAAIESRNRRSKPLPPLPKAAWKALAKAKWYRLPVKRRMGVLLCVCIFLMRHFYGVQADCLLFSDTILHAVDRLPQSSIDQAKGKGNVRNDDITHEN